MTYPNNVGEILFLMGYKDTDFIVINDNGVDIPELIWSGGSPIPSETEVNNFYANWIASPDRLTEQQTQAKALVDQTAERARVKYITIGSGQSLAYQEKAEEAADYIAAGYPAPSGSPPVYEGYPFIQAEVNATGKTKEQAADDIIAAKSTWVSVGANIEEVRLGGKKNIDDAVDEAGVDSAKNAAITALEEL